MASLVNSIVLLALWATVATAQEKVQVSVYFESYCPDSVRFLTKQLYPAFVGPFSKYVNVSLIPYGKAKTNKTQTPVTFECHHGEKECKGNKVIACVLDDKDVTFENKFKFINCTSSTIAADTKREEYPVNQCATGITGLNAEKIINCSTGTEGDTLLEKYGDKTMEMFANGLASVPTVVFNNKFVQAEQDAAVSNFQTSLCSKISGTKPAECTKSGASSLQAAILPLLALLYIVYRV